MAIFIGSGKGDAAKALSRASGIELGGFACRKAIGDGL
jgi:hypothetical protein